MGDRRNTRVSDMSRFISHLVTVLGSIDGQSVQMLLLRVPVVLRLITGTEARLVMALSGRADDDWSRRASVGEGARRAPAWDGTGRRGICLSDGVLMQQGP